MVQEAAISGGVCAAVHPFVLIAMSLSELAT